MSIQVQQMFADLAGRYDAANEVLSFGVHRLWRAEAVRRSGAGAGDRVLDCATGTGDLAFAFRKAVGGAGTVVGTDFCAPMLEIARRKSQQRAAFVEFREADALALPVACLREMARVVKPGGRVVVLELGQPIGPFGALYRVYSRTAMPIIGKLLTGQGAAYQYLPRTAAAFPAGERFLALMDESRAFSSRRATPLMFGAAFVYVGTVAV
jgi:demethylmenaquinone methyltransferase/2-methoxy-6-polyprenyl-1,4-benzoquinol methylase